MLRPPSKLNLVVKHNVSPLASRLTLIALNRRKLRLGQCTKLDDAALRLLAAYRRAPPAHLLNSSRLPEDPDWRLDNHVSSNEGRQVSAQAAMASQHVQIGPSARSAGREILATSSADQLLCDQNAEQGDDELADNDLDSLPGRSLLVLS